MKSTNERCNDIQTKLIGEKKKRARRNKLIASLSICSAIILTLGLVLFIPYPAYSIDAYKDSEYYPLIQKLDIYRPKPKYKNNFERLQSAFQGAFKAGAAPSIEDMGTAVAPSADAYEEVTDNQTAGVIEGDLFKRSSTTAYYLSADYDSYSLNIYPLAGTATVRTAQIAIEPEKGTRFAGYTNRRELFLSQDATRATILTPCYTTQTRALYTAMISIDLVNRTELSRIYFSGDHVSARLVDGTFLIVNNFAVRGYNYDNESLYLPQYGSLSSLKSLPMSDIVLSENAAASRYTVLYTVKENGLELTDSLALLAYSDEVYVSEQNLYATLSYAPPSYMPPSSASGNADMAPSAPPIGAYRVTEIKQIGYRGGLEVKNTCTVDGEINDRYSLDEYGGTFRVVTSVSGVDETYDSYTSANLYCFDAQTFEKIACVERFAPDGERVMSARFKGDRAYVCTAIEYLPAIFNDPVFAFDLSDHNNITAVDTGTIPGYSLFLTAFKDDTLLGIGYGEGGRTDLKIEIYEETATAVESVAAYECDATFANDYKAYFIDRVNGRIGLGLVRNGKTEYCLFEFDGYNLTEILTVAADGDAAQQRAFALDGILYVFCPTSGIRTAVI